MSTLLIQDDGPIRTITLNRPERRNALNPEMQEELIAAFTGASSARVVLLAGAGESFCAGLDLDLLKQVAGLSTEQHHVEAERTARMFRALWECDVPTIALVHGAAMAGGTGLATLCDFTLAAPEAQFGYTEARIGFVPALVSAYLSLQVGDKLARSLLLTARRFSAEEAYRMGLVTEVVPREELQVRAQALAAELLALSPESLRATKRLLRAQQAAWLDSALGLAMGANAASRQTADFREGVASFLEKRKPVWPGK
jgi:methylglutaconyl-CoA hydratase